MPKASTTTVVFKRDGRHHVTVEDMSPEDALRWAAEGYSVFKIGISGAHPKALWAVQHVNSGKIMDSWHTSGCDPADSEFLLLEKKGE